jgi:hypothetical protein
MGGLSETGFLRETARIVEILWRNPVSCRDRDRVYGPSETGFLRETAWEVEILWRNPVSCRDRDRVYGPSETGFLGETAWEVEILWRNPVSCRDRDRQNIKIIYVPPASSLALAKSVGCKDYTARAFAVGHTAVPAVMRYNKISLKNPS